MEFVPEYISIEITLHGKYGTELMNGAVSSFIIDNSTPEKTAVSTILGPPSVALQRDIAKRIAELLHVKAHHAV